MYMPTTFWTWSFLLVSLVQAAIALALESYIFAKFQTSLNSSAINSTAAKTTPTYLSVFMFGYIYQLILVWDALRLKNTIQVIGLTLYNIGILVYASIQKDQIHDAIVTLLRSGFIDDLTLWDELNPFLIALPCLMALGTLILAGITWKLYDEFAWTIYKHISADLRLKRRYLTYQIYIALLKFDFFFFLGFTVQFLVVVGDTSDAEFFITIAAVPVTIILLLLAGYWTRKESILGMITIIIIYFAALAYFLFKLVRMYQHNARARDYLPARKSLTTFAVITILLLIVTIITACICTHNFNKGLKPHIGKRRKVPDHNGPTNYKNEVPLAGPVPSRMTID